MRRTVKDLAGHQVGAGDRIVAAFRRGDQADIRVGRVVGFGERAEPYGTGRKETLEVEWEASGVKKSQIFVHLKRFALIGE